jgi:hypothetical protein
MHWDQTTTGEAIKVVVKAVVAGQRGMVFVYGDE